MITVVTLLDGSAGWGNSGASGWACWKGTQWSRYWTEVLDGDIVVAALVDGLDSKVVVALLGEIAGRGGGGY